MPKKIRITKKGKSALEKFDEFKNNQSEYLKAKKHEKKSENPITNPMQSKNSSKIEHEKKESQDPNNISIEDFIEKLKEVSTIIMPFYDTLNDEQKDSFYRVIKENKNLKSITVINAKFQEQDFKNLCRAIGENKNLESIVLSRLKLDDFDIGYLSKNIENHPTLKTIDLSENLITEKGFKVLKEAVLNGKNLITEVKLTGCPYLEGKGLENVINDAIAAKISEKNDLAAAQENIVENADQTSQKKSKIIEEKPIEQTVKIIEEKTIEQVIENCFKAVHEESKNYLNNCKSQNNKTNFEEFKQNLDNNKDIGAFKAQLNVEGQKAFDKQAKELYGKLQKHIKPEGLVQTIAKFFENLGMSIKSCFVNVDREKISAQKIGTIYDNAVLKAKSKLLAEKYKVKAEDIEQNQADAPPAPSRSSSSPSRPT